MEMQLDKKRRSRTIRNKFNITKENNLKSITYEYKQLLNRMWTIIGTINRNILDLIISPFA